MELLIVGCVAFVLLHLGISSTPLRGIMQGALGENGYLGVYSVLAFAGLGLMIYGYSQSAHADFVWYPSPTAYKVTKVFLLFSLVLLAMGMVAKNPTAVKMDAALEDDVQGIVKITRHPVQWGILLFAIGHIIANGDVASLMFFGTFAVVSFFGMFAIDARKRKEEDSRWVSFMSNTSMVPFGAIAQGKVKFSMADISWGGLVAGIALYAAIYWFHDLVSGGVALM